MIYMANAFRKQESIPLLFDNEMYLKSAQCVGNKDSFSSQYNIMLLMKVAM